METFNMETFNMDQLVELTFLCSFDGETYFRR